MPSLLQDLRYAARSLRNTPGFTAVAVLTLALGVGANTAVFSLINAVMLRPLPYEQPDRLVLVWESTPFFGVVDSPVAPANYVDWRARGRSFEEMGALEDRSYRVGGEGVPEIVDGALVTASAFRALRSRPILGRVFRDGEDRAGAPKVAVIGEGFWRRRFGADPSVIGSALRLNDQVHTVVGVLPAGAELPSEYRDRLGEIWTPLVSTYTPQEMAERGRHNWMVIARLRPGVSRQAADSEMRAIGASLAREYPDTNEKVGAFVAPMREHFVRSKQRILYVLLGTVVFLLLIACSNLANLLLTRAAGRAKEVAVRAALGAGAGQLLRQFLCESLLLCAVGSGAGLLLASFTFEFLAHLAPGDMAGLKNVGLDGRVLGFTVAVALFTTVLFGLVPLLELRKLDLNHSLKQSARSVANAAGSRRLRGLLISTEVALAFMLLIGAALLLQTFARLRSVEPGFRTNGLLTMRLRHARNDQPGYSAQFQREVLRRISAVPGVVSAGFSNHIPVVSKGDINGAAAEGRVGRDVLNCLARMASPGYLKTMGIPILQGRDINERDVDGAPRVVVINQTLANAAWPGQNPIGRRLLFSRASAEVVGVAGDIRTAGLDAAVKPEYYISTLQFPFPPNSLAIHTQVDAESLVPAVRRAIWSVQPDLPITDIETMDQILDGELLQRRVQTWLLGAFAALALLLAAVGLYGVLANLVGRQIPEIGLRMALGAEPRTILRRILGHGLGLAAAGLLVGVAGALALSRLLAGLLFGVKPTDPLTYCAVGIVLLAAAALASWLPARRAMRVDPIVALRQE